MMMSMLEGHPLLENTNPAYSNSTVRRAFIVWMHCGQKNSFRDVCKFYHHLETMEEKLPADRRASSRYHEFNMFSTPPPTSPYLEQIFPSLYTLNNTENNIKKPDPIQKGAASKIDALTELKIQNGVTKIDILDTSTMIKKYCKSHMITLRKFLIDFKDFAEKCNLSNTVHNVAFYIKRKMVEEELLMVQNYAKSLNFLNLGDEGNVNDLKKLPKSAFQIVSFENKPKGKQADFETENSYEEIISTKYKESDLKRYWNDLTHNHNEMKTGISRT